MLIGSPFPFDAAFIFRERRPGDEAGLVARLIPQERELLAPKATPKRIAEFALGRDCGREALRRLSAMQAGARQGGVPSEEAPPDRAPQGEAPPILRRERGPAWPPGIVGSLAHSRGAAVAVVAPAARYRGLGVDLERLDRDAATTTRRTLRPEEREALAGRAPALAVLWFCVKESIFKALHPLTGVYLGFQDARVQAPSVWPDFTRAGAGVLEWELLKASGEGFPAGMRGQAGWATTGSAAEPPWLVTGVWIAA